MSKVSKELVMQFIKNDDGTITVKVKPSEIEYTEYELYLAYRTLYQTLHDIGFDWSIEGTIETIVQNKEEK